MYTKIILFLLCSICAYSQNSIPDLVVKLKEASLSVELIDTSKRNFNFTSVNIGSGFIIMDKGRLFGITNWHVARRRKVNEVLAFGINSSKGKRFGTAELIYFDEKLDIAICSLTNKFTNRDSIKGGSSLSLYPITLDLLAKNEQLHVGDELITIGYPFGMGSEENSNNPIVRFGRVAQEKQANSLFVIDGLVNQGNSGSPVFNTSNGKLVGMICSYRKDFISLYDDFGILMANLPYNSGLTYCIPADEILKMIDAIKK